MIQSSSSPSQCMIGLCHHRNVPEIEQTKIKSEYFVLLRSTKYRCTITHTSLQFFCIIANTLLSIHLSTINLGNDFPLFLWWIVDGVTRPLHRRGAPRFIIMLLCFSIHRSFGFVSSGASRFSISIWSTKRAPRIHDLDFLGEGLAHD